MLGIMNAKATTSFQSTGEDLLQNMNWIELNVVSVEKVWYGSKIKQWFGKLCLLLFGNHTKLYILL